MSGCSAQSQRALRAVKTVVQYGVFGSLLTLTKTLTSALTYHMWDTFSFTFPSEETEPTVCWFLNLLIIPRPCHNWVSLHDETFFQIWRRFIAKKCWMLPCINVRLQHYVGRNDPVWPMMELLPSISMLLTKPDLLGSMPLVSCQCFLPGGLLVEPSTNHLIKLCQQQIK